MIAYEVTVVIDEEQAAAFEKYMRDRHIPDVLATGAFERASFECSEAGRYRTRYIAADRQSLDEYLRRHAPRLRDDFAAHFSERVQVTREEWIMVEAFA